MITLGLIVLAVIFVAVWGFWILGRPAYHRHKPLALLEKMTNAFASVPFGSLLIMRHERSHRLFQFRKAEDTGTEQQRIVFGFPEAGWSKPYFSAVLEWLKNSTVQFDLFNRTDQDEPLRLIEVTLEGDRHDLGRQALSLMSQLVPLVGLDERGPYTYHIESNGFDRYLEARVNADYWEDIAQRTSIGWLKRMAERRVHWAGKGQ